MLNIGKLAAGPSTGRYYEEQVAHGREEYYAGEGERPGPWVGGGAADLGLTGEVADGQTVRLLTAEHPESGEPIRTPMAEGAVAGFDLTFRAPKSVSVIFGIGENAIARRVRRAHEAAVADALGYLEREACRARRGKGGAIQVVGGGFVGAAFEHRTSRAGDPVLHTHVVIANETQGLIGAGPHSTAARSTPTARPPATSTRRRCAPSSASDSASPGSPSSAAPPILLASRAISSSTSPNAAPRSSA
ncbi:hypothetical protein DSM104299_00268 [Baekduia alba]|nr:hypothetical protein DSM104299_00268 [Baekduia alba]